MSRPEPTQPVADPQEPRRISDSPLFWFFIFGAMGLLALVAISPKHAQRQERLERMADSRERPFAGRVASPSAANEPRPAEQSFGRAEPRLGETAPPRQHETPPADDPPASRSLLPLMTFLAAVLAIAAAAVGTARYLRLAQRRAEGRNTPRPISKEQP